MKTLRLLVVILIVATSLFIIDATESQAEVSVYDADGQYLGMLLYNGVDGIAMQIFIPSYEKTATLAHDGYFYGDYLYFESSNCSGVAYLYYRFSRNEIIKNQNSFYSQKSIESEIITLNSYLPPSGLCKASSRSDLSVVPAQEVILPFEAPVATPLSFVYEPAPSGKRKK